LWPPRSPDLVSCDFYLWGYLKGKVYENHRTIDQLKKNIRRSIKTIDINVLHLVTLNVIKRAQKCTDANGRQFQHFV
jgi:predicted transcriptional regulator